MALLDSQSSFLSTLPLDLTTLDKELRADWSRITYRSDAFMRSNSRCGRDEEAIGEVGGEDGMGDSEARLEAMNIRGDASSNADSSDSDVMAARSFVNCDSVRPSRLANAGTLNDLTFCNAYSRKSHMYQRSSY